MPRFWRPSREAPWQTLKDKARDKCLICSQAGHWAKECPNHDKSSRMACHECHQLGHWVTLCLRDPGASRSSAKPTLTMVQEDLSGPLQPAHLSQITIMGLEPRVQRDVAAKSKKFLVEPAATYSILTSCSRTFSPNTCTILGAIGKTITKRFT